ncbi:MAG: GDSL-type esterase/lipase family protein [Planctomycetota bacterium]
MKTFAVAAVLAVIVGGCGPGAPGKPASPDGVDGALPTAPGEAQPVPTDEEAPWYEDEVRAFEAADAAAMPEPGRVLFTGSSSVRLWPDLAGDMAPIPVLNRGFGGSSTPDVLAVMDRVVLPYEPSVIVYYCGDNDLGADNTDARAAAEGFFAFVERVHAAQPGTPILYLSIKPSPLRFGNWASAVRANQLVAQYAAATDHVTFVDVSTCLLGEDGQPRPEYYADDDLHLSDAAYAAWAKIVRAELEAVIH